MPFFPFNRLPKLAATAVVILPIAFAVHFQVNSMKQSLALRERNAAIVANLKGAPVGVFVGGTSGIGQGITEAFARWRDGNAHIIIVGRNEAAAKEMHRTLSKTHNHYFLDSRIRPVRRDSYEECTLCI